MNGADDKRALECVEQRELARALVGKRVRFADEFADKAADATSYLVTAADDAMVEIDGFVGLFAPQLFVVEHC